MLTKDKILYELREKNKNTWIIESRYDDDKAFIDSFVRFNRFLKKALNKKNLTGVARKEMDIKLRRLWEDFYNCCIFTPIYNR
jgi:hypothetical protein